MPFSIQQLRETQKFLLEKVDVSFQRFLANTIDFNQRLIGIVGPRGVGKTTLMLQHIKRAHGESGKALYVLADLVLFRERGDLFNLAREWYLKHEGALLAIDEIHRYENWNQELKNIYDAFPDLNIMFSGSSSLNLIRGKYDLSRRGVLYSLPGLSFREYLELEKKIKLDAVDFQTLMNTYETIAERVGQRNTLKDFHDYLERGYYPFFRESEHPAVYNQQLNTILDKIIYEDIASFYKLKTQNLAVFKHLLSFLATSKPGELNVNKLAHSLGKNHATIGEYLEILQETGVVRFLSTQKTGHALIRNAKKVFLDNTNLYASLRHSLAVPTEIGTVRELFLLNQLQNAGLAPTYSSQGDFELNGMMFEVGGRNKSRKPLAPKKHSYLVLDNILSAQKGVIPLYVFGFLY